MDDRFIISEFPEWEAAGVPVSLALEEPVRLSLTEDPHGIARAYVHTGAAQPASAPDGCYDIRSNSLGPALALRQAMTDPALVAELAIGRQTIEPCYVCERADPRLGALFPLLWELRTAAIWAQTYAETVPVLTALADGSRQPEPNLLHLTLLNRAELEFPAAAGQPVQVDAHGPGTVLEPWWQENSARWRAALEAAVTGLRSRQTGWERDLHLVAPTVPLGRAGIGRTELRHPDPGAGLLPYLACAPLAGLLAWPNAQHAAIFAVPADVAATGTGTAWVDLGPTTAMFDLDTFAHLYAATFSETRPATADGVAAIHAALRHDQSA